MSLDRREEEAVLDWLAWRRSAEVLQAWADAFLEASENPEFEFWDELITLSKIFTRASQHSTAMAQIVTQYQKAQCAKLGQKGSTTDERDE